jgi:peptidyl-prolyl cis-trans isomerase C
MGYGLFCDTNRTRLVTTLCCRGRDNTQKTHHPYIYSSDHGYRPQSTALVSHYRITMMVQRGLFSLLLVALAHSFTPLSVPRQGVTALHMGWFDKAFGNQDYKGQDLRVRASHILIKGDNDLEMIDDLMGEIFDRTRDQPDLLRPVFAEVARRESQCSSAAQGGDLGSFGKGKMVQEFDWILFPEDPARTAPPKGSMVGPVLTEFGCHVILVTQRDLNRDQVEEKLARKD